MYNDALYTSKRYQQIVVNGSKLGYQWRNTTTLAMLHLTFIALELQIEITEMNLKAPFHLEPHNELKNINNRLTASKIRKPITPSA